MTSLFTVYKAYFSQDSWVSMMDRSVESLPISRAIIYFPTMIFFLWLMKSIFLAVITEAFNEIRVELQPHWEKKDKPMDNIKTEAHITGDDRSWEFVPANNSNELRQDSISRFLLLALNSTAFHLLAFVAILVNSIITASMSFRHDGRPRSDFYHYHYYIEVIIREIL